MQQQQQKRFFSWPRDTWYEDALGCREKKGSGAYLKNQKVLWNMQQRAASQAAGFPPHSFAIGSNSSSSSSCSSSSSSTADGAADGAAAVSLEHVQYGEFSCPSVQQLREECRLLKQQLDQDEQQQQQQQHVNGVIVWHTLPHTNVLNLYAHDADSRRSCCDDSTFQAASQFNCLEMTHPSVMPEAGIAGYVFDRTQGPASAMACAAGTAFRNYLVNVDNVMHHDSNNNNGSRNNNDIDINNDITNLGQTEQHQINTLADILNQLEQRVGPMVHDYDLARRPLIRVRNGYAEATEDSLHATHAVLNNDNDDDDEEDEWIRLGRVGIQHETQVTFPTTTTTTGQRRRLVTQVYCSAVPISYSNASMEAWEPLAKIVLKSCYEATLLVAVRNVARAMLEQRNNNRRCGGRRQTGTANPPHNNNNEDDDDDDEYNSKIYRLGRVYLTKVGGGAFGNEEEWILNAMRHAHERVATFGIPLNVFIVNFGKNSLEDELLVQQLNTQTVKNNKPKNNNNNNHCRVH